MSPTTTPETREAWGRPSLRLSLAGLVFLLVTGLGILLLPFSTGAQVVVLAHTLGGLVVLVPLGVFLARHLSRHALAPLSHLMLLGWASGLLVAGGMVTGVVLTWQAAFGTRIDPDWDWLHTVGGIAALPILAAHLVTAVRRRVGERPYVARRLGEALALGAAASVACFAVGQQAIDPPVQRASLPDDYGYRYGQNPFAPSLARTDRLFRLDQDRRWEAFLGECLAHAPVSSEAGASPASDEALTAFLAKADDLHAADRAAAERGESYPHEQDGLATDARRLDALRGALATKDEDNRRARLASLREEVQRERAATEQAFREHEGLHPDALAGSASCGSTGCHEQIVKEWEPSAHRYASRSAFFQLIQKAMADVNGAESTRYCAGCHDPIALFSGAKNIYDEDLSSPGADEGVSCAACHSIVRTDIEGNANYTMAPPTRYLGEGGFVGKFLIRAYPRRHRAEYARPLLGTPELCGACHKQFIDKELNRATRVQLQNQYDSWKGSPWFVAGEADPRHGDPARTLACRDCHMRRTDSEDPVAPQRDGKHRHHGFIAANQWLPTYHGLPGAQRHVELTEQWLRGETVLPEIADRWPAGPIVPISIEAPAAVRAGETLKLRITLDNAKVGHTFPTGPLDMIQSWVDVTATLDGREVFRSGRLDERGFLEDGAFELKAEGVDRAGNLIDKHNLWDMVGARFRRAVHPGYSDTETFTFECACEGQAPVNPRRELELEAPAAQGELVITATLRYRKVNQALLNMLKPDGKDRAPITDMGTVVARVRVDPAP
jgi:hypothetical protein